ncbi:MAG: sigma-70 family RNA polymerase sigma factor, partial [Pseudomonadota bacterium]
VASDALGVAWKSAERFEGRAKVTTWLFGIAYRMAMRAVSRRSRRSSDVEYDEDIHAPVTETNEVETVFLRSQIARALESLSAEHRAVVELTYYHGLHYTEIAEIAGCPVGTVKTRMMHARAKLKKIMSAPANDTAGDAAAQDKA